MRKLTALSSLLMAAAMLVGCAAETQVKAKDNNTTISPTVEQQGEETTEVQVSPAPEGDKHEGRGHDKHDSGKGR
jgi:PBP1b-binding outer membrane lipoprotein LpoB